MRKDKRKPLADKNGSIPGSSPISSKRKRDENVSYRNL